MGEGNSGRVSTKLCLKRPRNDLDGVLYAPWEPLLHHAKLNCARGMGFHVCPSVIKKDNPEANSELYVLWALGINLPWLHPLHSREYKLSVYDKQMLFLIFLHYSPKCFGSNIFLVFATNNKDNFSDLGFGDSHSTSGRIPKEYLVEPRTSVYISQVSRASQRMKLTQTQL